MTAFDNTLSWLGDFSGTVRLFPLPNLVLFPHMLHPLHVFEPRYRDLVEEALAEDRLLALAVLAPGWEKSYQGRPPLRPVACLGRITVHHRLDGGEFNLLTLGLQRVRLVKELTPTKSFREAQVELCEDDYPARGDSSRPELRRRLRETFSSLMSQIPEARKQLDQILAGDVPLGVLTDIISHMLSVDSSLKETLLAELDVDRRAELLLEQLSTDLTFPCDGQSSTVTFPPDFSLN